MKTALKRLALALFVLLVLAQLVPVGRTNPPVSRDVAAPEDVAAVLRASCYDCHSNETRWPWYAYVAPVSWLVAKDVRQGRRHLNFSTWDVYDDRTRAHLLEEAVEEVEEGEMPLWFYVPLHPGSDVDAGERAAIARWAGASGARPERDHD